MSPPLDGIDYDWIDRPMVCYKNVRDGSNGAQIHFLVFTVLVCFRVRVLERIYRGDVDEN